MQTITVCLRDATFASASQQCGDRGIPDQTGEPLSRWRWSQNERQQGGTVSGRGDSEGC